MFAVPRARPEFLVAFRCKGRHFCPSCHARRLAEWSLWLDERLLARVPHRQIVFTIPKRLRPFFLYNRRRLGTLSQLAYRILLAYQRAALGEPDVAPGVIVCIQSCGSLAHWHPHLHVLMNDGAFRSDGSFVAAPTHDPSVLESAWQRAVLAWFVASEWLDRDAAAGMLAWPHSSFGVHVGPAIAGEGRDALLRLARYSARAPVAESRLRYDAGRAEVELVSDRGNGAYAGIHRFSAVEFIARWVDHVPDRYETRVRYYDTYATRRRIWWQRRGISLASVAAAEAMPSEQAAGWPALPARRRRWAELLRLVYKVEVEVCPRCGGAMKVLGFITEPAVVCRILAHLDRRDVDARAGPWTGAAAAPG